MKVDQKVDQGTDKEKTEDEIKEEKEIEIRNRVLDQYNSAVREIKERYFSAGRQNAESSAAGHDRVSEEYLAATLEHIVQTRAMFMDDVRQLVTLIVCLFIAAAAIGTFAITRSIPNFAYVTIVAAEIICLISVFPITYTAFCKARAGYELYAASALQASVVHEAFGFHRAHLWFYHVERNLNEITVDDLLAVAGKVDVENLGNVDFERYWRSLIVRRWLQTSSSGRRDVGTSASLFLRWFNLSPTKIVSSQGNNLLLAFTQLIVAFRVMALLSISLSIIIAIYLVKVRPLPDGKSPDQPVSSAPAGGTAPTPR